MSSNPPNFDPYYRWLGLPKDQRPPTHYQLLGISPSEDDRPAINVAIKRQTNMVNSQREAKHDEIANRVLYEIQEAGVTILNPYLRKEYDASLTRRKVPSRRRVIANRPPSSKSVQTVGEGTEFVWTYFSIVSILLGAFIIMAMVTFLLPWQRVMFDPQEKDEQPKVPDFVADGAQPDQHQDRQAAAGTLVDAEDVKVPQVDIKHDAGGHQNSDQLDGDVPDSSLDGEWTFLDGIAGGNPIAEARRIVIAGHQYTLSFGDKVIEGKIQFYPKETPKHLNWIPERGGSPGYAGKVQLGICELSNNGTTLRFCVGTPEGIRPTEYDGTPQGWSVQVYKKRSDEGSISVAPFITNDLVKFPICFVLRQFTIKGEYYVKV